MSQQNIIPMSKCDCGCHDLKPRYDFEKVGSIVKRSYVCEVCSICGYHVTRPFTVQQLLDAGVVKAEEVREAMGMAVDSGNPDITMEMALAVLVARRADP